MAYCTVIAVEDRADGQVRFGLRDRARLIATALIPAPRRRRRFVELPSPGVRAVAGTIVAGKLALEHANGSAFCARPPARDHGIHGEGHDQPSLCRC